MEKLKNSRKVKRSQATRTYNKLSAELGREVVDKPQIEVYFSFLVELQEQLDSLDAAIADALYESGASDEEQEINATEASEYRLKFLGIKNKVEVQLAPAGVSTGSRSIAANEMPDKRQFKLPQIQLRTFSGEIKDWLAFWSQFEKIHLDQTLHNSDKIQYLVMAMEPGSVAKELVECYPQTGENYPRVVEALQERFGDEDLLLQVYVRELLKLVVSNASTCEKIPLQQLYFRLESHLRSLQSLKLAKADPYMWIFPLVESCVPGETLLAWQRNIPISANKRSPAESSVDMKEEAESKLVNLMKFLRNEVQIQQKIKLAQSGFEDGQEDRLATNIKKDEGKKKQTSTSGNKDEPTLATFQVLEESESCCFCGRQHETKNCMSAQGMSAKQKLDKLKEKRCCFICFRSGHHIAKNCRSFVKCLVCGKRHLVIMCPEIEGKRPEEKNRGNPSKELNTEGTEVLGVTSTEATKKVALQTLIVNLKDKDNGRKVRVLLDSGSQRSYIKSNVPERLRLKPGSEEKVAHSLFGGTTTGSVRHKIYTIRAEKLDGSYNLLLKVRDQATISNCIPRLQSVTSGLAQELESKGVQLTDVGNGGPQIELLIGADYYAKLLTGKIVPLRNGMVAIETHLGWTISGETDSTVSMAMNDITMTTTDTDITRLWDLETLGVRDPIEIQTTVDREADVKREFFESLQRKEDGRYVARLPWKKGHPPLPTNRDIAEKRMRSATRKLQMTGQFGLYHKIFTDWLTEGFVEEVKDEAVEVAGKEHFLPHRPVFKPESLTTPVRPVFDASCRSGKHPSLNDCLEKGASYIQKIPSLLLRFREKRVGFTADIRKAFQMIEVYEGDRDALRFLWWNSEAMDKTKVLRHVRVVFGATSSPFTLGAVLEYHLTHVDPPRKELAMTLLESFYVDNCIHSVDSPKEYLEFQNGAKNILAEAKMDLRMWMSNSDENIDDGKISVLGLKWNRKQDFLVVDISTCKIPEIITKRNILSAVQKIFDPIGFTQPATIAMKILLQEAWLARANWDERLPQDLALKFKTWYSEIDDLEKIQLPRLCTSGDYDKETWTLHTFSDASQRAYAAVVMLRIEDQNNVHLHFLAAKARVAPLQRSSMPRLELLGCLLGCFLTDSVKKALKLNDITSFYWTDSTTALAWIRRDECWATFVGNRVAKIRQLSSVEEWRFIPGLQNHADFLTRGCTPNQLLRSRWWDGPSWLCGQVESSSQESGVGDEEVINKEKQKGRKVDVSLSFVDIVRDDHSFSQYVRIRAWTLRFVRNAKKKTQHRSYSNRVPLYSELRLSDEEIMDAHVSIIREMQSEGFPDLKDVPVNTVRHTDNTLRVKTRIVERDDLVNFKLPFLLPKGHPMVGKLIKEAHLTNCHAGVGTLMEILREKYWIIQCRRTVQRQINLCHRCKKLRAKPVVVDMAPLPRERVQDAEPFQTVGIDLAGPLNLKHGRKIWIVVFTCAVYRAVYFDLVTSLQTKAFIRVMKNFVYKHRRPDVVYTDNGTNFQGTANYLKGFDWNKIDNCPPLKLIKWKFNVPLAPWWGGMWERLIRMLKDLLKRMLGKASLTKDELEVALKEAEDTMNRRPLTYASENPEDLKALSPMMFLKPLGDFRFPEAETSEAARMRIRYSYVNELKAELRMRFRKEYLSQLVGRPERKSSKPLGVGDLVLIKNENKKRIEWPLGRVIETIQGRDGLNRVAVVRTENGVKTRAVQLLHPLEMDKRELSATNQTEECQLEDDYSIRAREDVKN